jgi:large subunit ribosomal protein L10
MAITKVQKIEILEKLKDIFSNNKALAFTGFDSMSVGEITELRGNLRQEGVGYFVCKKTLLRKALSEQGYEGELPELPGNIAVVYGLDETAPARMIAEAAKKFDERIQLVGGVFQGEYKDRVEIGEIALIPSLDVLRGMFVNVINSPIQGMAIVLDQIAQKKEA